MRAGDFFYIGDDATKAFAQSVKEFLANFAEQAGEAGSPSRVHLKEGLGGSVVTEQADREKV